VSTESRVGQPDFMWGPPCKSALVDAATSFTNQLDDDFVERDTLCDHHTSV